MHSHEVFLFFIALCFCSVKGLGQRVEGSAYDLMLKGLLSHSVPEVGVNQVSPDSAVFLDARSREEFDVSHIPGATWVGYDDFSLDRLPPIGKDIQLVVYCSVGFRSEKISEKLKDSGFEEVSNLYGGIFEWVNRGKPVVSPQNDTTDRIHAYNRAWGYWLTSGEKVYP